MSCCARRVILTSCRLAVSVDGDIHTHFIPHFPV